MKSCRCRLLALACVRGGRGRHCIECQRPASVHVSAELLEVLDPLAEHGLVLDRELPRLRRSGAEVEREARRRVGRSPHAHGRLAVGLSGDAPRHRQGRRIEAVSLERWTVCRITLLNNMWRGVVGR